MENLRFKYRVWDNINNRYEKEMIFNADGVICHDDGLPYCNGEHQDDFTIEQCTGLKDKNGKLIYEGDVIKIKDDYDTYGQFAGEIREVYYHEGGFRLKPKWNKNARGNYLEDTEDFEIIGNIHDVSKTVIESRGKQ